MKRLAYTRLALALLAIAFAAGCHHAAEVDRGNARLVDELLTAITLQNVGLLDQAAGRAQARREAGLLAEPDYQALAAIIDKARAGNWSDAGSDGYAFRKQRPFVRYGQ